jgi:hypothetical protein
MINIASDTHGRVYQIWKQDQQSSCGVASIWMARGIARQASFAEEEWGLAVRVYQGAVNSAIAAMDASPSGPVSLDPTAYSPASPNQTTFANTFTNFGLFGTQVSVALRNEGLTVTHTVLNGTPPRIEASKIAFNKPAIVFVKWDGVNSGAHFVVVGRCTGREVSFLDPWDGKVNQLRNNGRYTALYGDAGTIQQIIYISA